MHSVVSAERLATLSLKGLRPEEEQQVVRIDGRRCRD